MNTLIWFSTLIVLPYLTKQKRKKLNKDKATMLYQCTNILYCLTTGALMVIKRAGGEVFQGGHGRFSYNDCWKIFGWGEKRLDNLPQFSARDYCFPYKTMSRGLNKCRTGRKKTVLNQNACFSMIFCKLCIISRFLYSENVSSPWKTSPPTRLIIISLHVWKNSHVMGRFLLHSCA